MQLSNVIFDDDKYVIDPVFNEFVQKFALEHPSYVLSSKNTVEHFSSHRSVDTKTKAPDDKMFLQRLDVRLKATGEYLGRIGVARVYRRNYDHAFFVDSWRIENQRGDRNRTFSSKLVSIMRTAKRSLIPKGYEEVLSKAAEEISEHMRRSLSDLMSPITHGRFLPSGHNTAMQMYIYHSLMGSPQSAQADPQFRPLLDAIKSQKYRRGVEEYNLAITMRQKDEVSLLRAVVSHNGGYLYTLKGTEGILYHTFNELPEWMQNHVGVLQLMQDRELVNNVGYRLNDTHFAVLQPE